MQPTTRLHEERLDGVVDRLLSAGVQSVLDLGCGNGALLERLLAEPRLLRIVGVDRSLPCLDEARARLASPGGVQDPRLALRQGSVLDLDDDLTGFDAAVLVETIEHLDPAHLSRLERGLFLRLRPERVVVTTPNREYNVLFGLERRERRHPHHRFEWDRAKFERWASGAARRTRYDVTFESLGPVHDWRGSPTQMAVFVRQGP
jgi:small RNA 2'-O-methyltransferase